MCNGVAFSSRALPPVPPLRPRLPPTPLRLLLLVTTSNEGSSPTSSSAASFSSATFSSTMSPSSSSVFLLLYCGAFLLALFLLLLCVLLPTLPPPRSRPRLATKSRARRALSERARRMTSSHLSGASQERVRMAKSAPGGQAPDRTTSRQQRERALARGPAAPHRRTRQRGRPAPLRAQRRACSAAEVRRGAGGMENGIDAPIDEAEGL